MLQHTHIMHTRWSVLSLLDFNPQTLNLPEGVLLKNKGTVQCGERVMAYCPSGSLLSGAAHGTVASQDEVKWMGETPNCEASCKENTKADVTTASYM